MAKTEYLLRLFRAHVANLHDPYPEVGNIFVCPICTRMIPEGEIYSGFLTDGHIWPLKMRKKSKVANDQTVLLCQDCNKSAGTRGDAQMQLLEKINEDSEKGDLHGIRTIEIIERPGEKPIRMRVNIHHDDLKSIHVTGRLNREKHWLGSSPEDQRRFEELTKKSMETQQPFSIVVHPFRGYKHNLAAAGWITSAYLMAFYALGYRYILHNDLDFIRDYITRSFDPAQEINLALPQHENFQLITHDTSQFPDPVIKMAIPVDQTKTVHLEVDFLRYEVNLPILLDQKVFNIWLSQGIKQLPGQKLPSAVDGILPTIYAQIDCTKTVEHTCLFDYLMEKPIPNT